MLDHLKLSHIHLELQINNVYIYMWKFHTDMTIQNYAVFTTFLCVLE